MDTLPSYVCPADGRHRYCNRLIAVDDGASTNRTNTTGIWGGGEGYYHHMASRTSLPPVVLPPLLFTRRRVIIACTNCRKRRIKCLTPEDPPLNPCERCLKKGLRCEYVTVSDQRGESASKHSKNSAADSANGSGSKLSAGLQLPTVTLAAAYDAELRGHSRPCPPDHGNHQPRAQSDMQNLTSGAGYGPYYGGAYTTTNPPASFPAPLQPRPYRYPAGDCLPTVEYSTDPSRRPVQRDSDELVAYAYGEPLSWARCGICP
ncbi:hypothetical protein C8R47DRAFT_1146532 [Mycena vitilis]|nr:hypothetical protein C8R47DRAFT_1146532 [Mycena vitilis]